MNKLKARDSLSALAHETRLDAFRLLVQAEPAGLLAGEIAERLDVVQNTMSGNLATLSQAGLISSKREGRSIRYHLEIDAVRDLFSFLSEHCCGGRSELCDLTSPRDAPPFRNAWTTGRRFNVLFLCTGNSARSIMAEAIMNRDHGAQFRAFSAGTHPDGVVSPDTLAVLEQLGYPKDNLRSKSLEEFTLPDAPKMDFVFTVCDGAASERCPIWPGAPMSAHWGVPDPKAASGAEPERRLAFTEAFRMLEHRVGIFAKLPFSSLKRAALMKHLDEIGAGNGAGGCTD